MTSFQIKSEIKFNELLSIVEQLDASSLDVFLNKVLSVRAKQKTNAKVLSQKEADILLKINQVIPEKLQNKTQALRDKQETGTLTELEKEDLKKSVLEIEKLNAKKITLLSELAALKGIGLKSLMKDLCLLPKPSDV